MLVLLALLALVVLPALIGRALGGGGPSGWLSSAFTCFGTGTLLRLVIPRCLQSPQSELESALTERDQTTVAQPEWTSLVTQGDRFDVGISHGMSGVGSLGRLSVSWFGELQHQRRGAER